MWSSLLSFLRWYNSFEIVPYAHGLALAGEQGLIFFASSGSWKASEFPSKLQKPWSCFRVFSPGTYWDLVFLLIACLILSNRRECITIGVIFVEKGHMDNKSIFESANATQDYFDFISAIGWSVTISLLSALSWLKCVCSNVLIFFLFYSSLQIDLNKHTGFSGGLDPKVTGAIAPYYADMDTELIFHVSTLITDKGSPPSPNNNNLF